MKPRPTQSKNKQQNVSQQQPISEVIKRQPPTRTIYVRDDERTKVGFAKHEKASEFADTLVKPNCMGSREREDMRVRVAFRNRTGLYDVVVKVAKEVPIVDDKAIGE